MAAIATQLSFNTIRAPAVGARTTGRCVNALLPRRNKKQGRACVRCVSTPREKERVNSSARYTTADHARRKLCQKHCSSTVILQIADSFFAPGIPPEPDAFAVFRSRTTVRVSASSKGIQGDGRVNMVISKSEFEAQCAEAGDGLVRRHPTESRPTPHLLEKKKIAAPIFCGEPFPVSRRFFSVFSDILVLLEKKYKMW